MKRPSQECSPGKQLNGEEALLGAGTVEVGLDGKGWEQSVAVQSQLPVCNLLG